jgi:hypothetical protein
MSVFIEITLDDNSDISEEKIEQSLRNEDTRNQIKKQIVENVNNEPITDDEVKNAINQDGIRPELKQDDIEILDPAQQEGGLMIEAGVIKIIINLVNIALFNSSRVIIRHLLMRMIKKAVDNLPIRNKPEGLAYRVRLHCGDNLLEADGNDIEELTEMINKLIELKRNNMC